MEIIANPLQLPFHISNQKLLQKKDEIRENKRSPDIDALYEHIMKSEALNADKNLIETIIAELTKQNVIIDKKTYHGLGSFYKSSTAKQSISRYFRKYAKY